MGEGKREGTAKVEYCVGCGHALPQLGTMRVFFHSGEGADRTHDNDECVKLRNEKRFGVKAPDPDHISISKAERSALLKCEEALMAAKRLCDNVNEFGHVTDQIIHDAAEVQIRSALSLLDEARHGK